MYSARAARPTRISKYECSYAKRNVHCARARDSSRINHLRGVTVKCIARCVRNGAEHQSRGDVLEAPRAGEQLNIYIYIRTNACVCVCSLVKCVRRAYIYSYVIASSCCCTSSSTFIVCTSICTAQLSSRIYTYRLCWLDTIILQPRRDARQSQGASCNILYYKYTYAIEQK